MPIVAINKPKHITSHDAVAKVRKITGIKKVGHAGTLDPLASGVLVIGIGRESTKKLGVINESDKEYRATITLGATSTTDDAEGALTFIPKTVIPSKASILTALKSFIGEIQQQPPVYSAIKIHGKTAYRYARMGQQVKLGARTVTIYEINLSGYQWPEIKVQVRCGSGVYIRSLARDLGDRLQTGAYLSGLERTRIGDYKLEQAIELEDFADWWRQQA